MTRDEVLYTRLGEMMDLITCMQIENGELVPKRKLSYDEAMELK